MLSRLFIAALCLLFVMFNCVFVTFLWGILDQVWYLIVSIPKVCRFSYFSLKFILELVNTFD